MRFVIATMTVIIAVLFYLVMGLHQQAKRRRIVQQHPRERITEPRIKVMFNPFNGSYMWVRLNPGTHTWEWECDATPAEVEAWHKLPSEEVKKYGVLIERRSEYVTYTQAKPNAESQRTESSRGSDGDSEAAKSE